MSRLSGPALALALALALAAAAPAEAARLVVLDFQGPATAAKRARASLVKRLAAEDGLEFVSKAEYAKRAAAAGVTRKRLATPAGVRKGAAAADVDGVFSAGLFRKKGRWKARLRFVDAGGTQRLDKTYALDKRQAFARADLERIAGFARAQGPKPKPKVAAVKEAPPPATAAGSEAPAKEGGVEVIRGFDESKGFPDEPPALVSSGGQPGLAPPRVEARLLAGGINRGYALQGPSSQVDYEMSGFAPVTGLAVSTFPFGPADSALAGLGLELALLRGFLSSRYVGADRQARSLGTPSTHWRVDARYRYRLLRDHARGPAVGLRLGWGGASFDAGEAPALAQASHSGLRAGLDLSQPLLPPFVRLDLSATLLPLAWPGDEVSDHFGSASSFGWGLRAEVGGALRADGTGLVYGLWGELTRVSDALGEGGEARESWLSWGVSAGYAL